MRLLALSAVVLLAPATVPSDDSSLDLSSGDDYTVLGALAELPVSTDTDGLMVQTGDLVAATELAGLERPSEPDIDAVASWIFPLTGLPREDEFAPLFVPLGQVFNYQYLRDIAEFDTALGWSLVDANAFVEHATLSTTSRPSGPVPGATHEQLPPGSNGSPRSSPQRAASSATLPGSAASHATRAGPPTSVEACR